MTKEKTDTKNSPRPPIVAVLGHVDHGKTSLLDFIRKAAVASQEHGGITQGIGAYQIEVPQKEGNKKITFIDTPGHEAFANMRSRGAAVADIAILVVAATEGVKPQTEESIRHIKAAGVPIIVAANKMDLPEANIDKVKQQLAKLEILVESFGGDVVLIPISAKTGDGVDKLLEAILLVSEMKEISADPTTDLEAVIIESKMDKSRGPLATLIVQKGTLNLGDTIYTDTTEAKVRSMQNEWGKTIETAPPATPAEIMGWKEVPKVGSSVFAQKQIAAEVVSKYAAKPFSLPPLETVKKLKLILKADVAGSLEAITQSLGEAIQLINTSTGDITESDILLAKSTGSVIIGFNTRASTKITKLAQTEKVRIKIYRIIYDLIDEINEVSQLMNKPEIEEELGTAQIIAQFHINDSQIAGVKILQGRLQRSDNIKLMRGDKEIARGRIKTIHLGKDDVGKVEAPKECGVSFDKQLDFVLTDRIIAYTKADLLS